MFHCIVYSRSNDDGDGDEIEDNATDTVYNAGFVNNLPVSDARRWRIERLSCHLIFLPYAQMYYTHFNR